MTVCRSKWGYELNYFDRNVGIMPNPKRRQCTVVELLKCFIPILAAFLPIHNCSGMSPSSTPTTTPLVPSTNSTKKDDLPLGWTRVNKRKRNGQKATINDKIEFDWSCCEDPKCTRDQEHDTMEAKNTEEMFHGQAIFFMHKIDPEWFQGYFLVNGLQKPWGLLAVQEDIDECLQCTDGGYRQISLTVMQYQRRKNVSWNKIEWTGGDMMMLNGSTISFEAERCLTGGRAVPLVKQYFRSLIEKLRNDEVAVEDVAEGILDVAPNLAVIVGKMKVCMLKSDDDDS